MAKQIAALVLREFTKEDWMSFSGAEGEKPLIGELDSHTIIVSEAGMSVIYWEENGDSEEWLLDATLKTGKVLAHAIAEELRYPEWRDTLGQYGFRKV